MTETLIASTSDTHYDERSRFAECIRIQNWVADDMAKRGVQLVVHNGDFYERESTPLEREAGSDWVRRVLENSDMTMVGGNHDARRDIELLGKLRGKHEIVVTEASAVASFKYPGGQRIGVGMLAWPKKAHLLAQLRDVPPSQANAMAQECLRDVIRGIGAELTQRNAEIRILSAHAQVRGAKVGIGQPVRALEMELALEEFALARCPIVLLGHIHLPQDWIYRIDTDAIEVHYTGSVRRCDFGEVEEKGYTLLTYDGDRLANIERIIAPSTLLVNFDAEWVDGRFMKHGDAVDLAMFSGIAAIQGTEFKFCYTVDADKQDVAKAHAQELHDKALAAGAASFLPYPTLRPTMRARAPEIASAPTLDTKLVALWERSDPTLTPERRARLLGKASLL